jgi:hypothetical protein
MADGWPRVAIRGGASSDGLGEPLEKALQRLLARVAFGPYLKGLKDDSAAAHRAPSVES